MVSLKRRQIKINKDFKYYCANYGNADQGNGKKVKLSLCLINQAPHH
jgi:hypothetical protein